jgi:hypothetical protein
VWSIEVVLDKDDTRYLLEMCKDEESNPLPPVFSSDDFASIDPVDCGQDQANATENEKAYHTLSPCRIATAARVWFDKDVPETVHEDTVSYKKENVLEVTQDSVFSSCFSPGKCAANKPWMAKEDILMREALREKEVQNDSKFWTMISTSIMKGRRSPVEYYR